MRIPVYGTIYTRSSSDGDPSEPVFRYFFAARDAAGGIFENSFSATRPHHLADMRYERVLYVFRWCEPLACLLRVLQNDTKRECAHPRHMPSLTAPVEPHGLVRATSSQTPAGHPTLSHAACVVRGVALGFMVTMVVRRLRRPKATARGIGVTSSNVNLS